MKSFRNMKYVGKLAPAIRAWIFAAAIFAAVIFSLAGCRQVKAFFKPGPDSNQVVKLAPRVRYIFLFDRIDASVIDKFHHLLFEPEEGLNDLLTQELPAGVKEISFMVYDAAADKNTPITMTLRASDENNDMGRKGREFLAALAADTARYAAVNDRYILINCSNIFSMLRDPGVDYHVAFFSRMVDNGGGAALPERIKKDGQNGYFHVVDGQDRCVPLVLDEMNGQLRNCNSWISHQLIQAARDNACLQHLKIQQYRGDTTRIYSGGPGYDEYAVHSFWRKLCDTMQVHVEEQGPVRFADYQFFPEAG